MGISSPRTTVRSPRVIIISSDEDDDTPVPKSNLVKAAPAVKPKATPAVQSAVAKGKQPMRPPMALIAPAKPRKPTKPADDTSGDSVSSTESDTEDYSDPQTPAKMTGPGTPTSYARLARRKYTCFPQCSIFSPDIKVSGMSMDRIWLKYRDIDGEVFGGSSNRPKPGVDVPSLGRKLDKYVDTFGLCKEFIDLLHKAATQKPAPPSRSEFIARTSHHLAVVEAVYFYKRLSLPLKDAIRTRRYAIKG